jgi:coenzyme F420-reducing hydrogenase delta subunit
MTDSKVIIFTCNWNPYSGLETAGVEHRQYSPVVHPIRVNCLGQLSPGIILKSFEKGASGVLLLGCPPGECHYQFGNRKAEEVYTETKQLLKLLGYQDHQFKLDWVAAGEGADFTEKTQRFADTLLGLKANHDE